MRCARRLTPAWGSAGFPRRVPWCPTWTLLSGPPPRPLHLAAALFGVGLGSLLALIERSGWRLIVAVAVFLALFIARDTPFTPLLRLSTHATTLRTSIAGPAAWLYIPGVILVAAAAILATRQA